MQTQLTLPSKRRVDTHGILVPFEQLLQPGEVLVGGTCTIQVLTGVDPDPAHMLEGSIQVRGTNLYQQIKLGVPGVIYSVTFVGETDLENSYTVETKQAVLEDQIPAGPIYQPFYFTSPPYPLEAIDGIESAGNILSGATMQIPIDGILSAASILSGDLRDILISYINGLPEGIVSDADILSGTLVDILITYEMDPDGIISSADILSGNLAGSLITYSNYPPEGILSSANILSGTLV